MKFFTRIDDLKPAFDISYHDSLALFGSCFAESMGARLVESKFRADVNPFGVLYNPLSVASAIESLLEPKELTAGDLFFYEGRYHSFAHHSRFSAADAQICLEAANDRLRLSAACLRAASRVLVTFGTAHVYRWKESGQVVSNCHKLPERLFVRERLSVSQIVEAWDELLSRLWERNGAQAKVIFTVSPVRHWRDGAHANQLSKSILLLAVEQLQAHCPERVAYFPAYELMMDELRDYRFYADDMFHPSQAATEYIWERFASLYMDEQTRQRMKQVEEIRKAVRHKPQDPGGASHRQFVVQTLLKMEQLMAEIPYLCFEKETKQLYEV
jgi:lysophospholipase L1-like esterase